MATGGIEAMSRALEELQAYYDRKKTRRDDEARNMELSIEHEKYDDAEFHLNRANQISSEMYAIQHCMSIVRSCE